MQRWIYLATLLPAAIEALGVCYDSYDPNKVDSHFQKIQAHFPAVRTYDTQFWNGANPIDFAAKYNLQLQAGIWLRSGDSKINQDLQAIIDGIHRHPNTVTVVFVGNEDLSNGWSLGSLMGTIGYVRSRLQQAGINVPVGTVQIDGDWLNNRNLASVSDVIGVNIHPFFGGSQNSKTNPIEDLKARWNQMWNAFGGKVQLVETGWPHQGPNSWGHQPSDWMAQDYYYKVQQWAAAGNGGAQPTYFMYHDNPNKGWGTVEGSFALADPSGNWKFDVGNNNNNGGGGGGGGGGGSNLDPYNLQIPIQLVTSRGKVLYEYANELHAFDNQHQFQDLWYYNSQTKQIRSRSNNQCLDVYNSNNNFYVHFYDCGDGSNGNQKWNLQNNKVVHATHSNLCLDADPNDGGQRVQVWSCVNGNSNQVFTVSAETQHMTLSNGQLVFAAHSDTDQLKFRQVWGSMGAVYNDREAMWTLDPTTGLMKSEWMNKCLDAYQAQNGGAIHLYNCDANNGNQKWQYDPSTKQLRHATHKGYCLDMASDSGDHPYLWQCHDPSDYWVKFQQFVYTV
ncbi:glycoside hydrolase [Thraustotheca clavata]|uniref:glucan endo-1,3-beta-D-glucosidase n=1 Tax=Thraustotheca clavata TaxID=74557 RepID=A0A0A7CMA4_9STRA|nr:secreted protein [Thraustotheca clavata]OQR98950.1 glycoside hydrolase [Thraustotheca clavata]